MSIEIKLLTLGIAATNCYIVGDTDTNQALVIDPVDNAEVIHQTADNNGWQIKLILATHGHYDHILAAGELKQLTHAPFYIHQNTPQVNTEDHRSPFIEQLFPPIPEPDRLLIDTPEVLNLGAITLETLFTPGHAPDHLCFCMRDQHILFGGDCLFEGSIGRTDFPNADYGTLMNSIFDKMLPLGDDVQVLPGHMAPTTIGRERETNPFLLQYANQKR